MNARVQSPPETQRPAAAAPRDPIAALDSVGSLLHETLGERVNGELRTLLIAGRLAPGDKLSLRKVAEALGVSMMPVRQAVSRLVADGALEVLPGKAVHVPVLSLAQFRELTRLRLLIEGYAAEEAARIATPAEIERIAGYEAAFRAAAAASPPDLGGAVSANRDLHFALYAAVGMPMLVETIERLWLKAGPILNLDMRAEARRLDRGSAVVQHALLVAALRARDATAAREALQSDIHQAAEHIAATGRLAQ
ncbi:GntR family transcriptional regulator [Bosea sp. TWI1241]|uniref:GntR family transcriptional regulator n=1 Tax=Bosea sp. TWI1241 TaxID=3148904 RepID=UPI003207C53E